MLQEIQFLQFLHLLILVLSNTLFEKKELLEFRFLKININYKQYSKRNET
jgi:hypothetical protein